MSQLDGSMNNNYKYITTNNELQTFCSQIEEASFLTVDTEFFTWHNPKNPLLCLVQVGAFVNNKIEAAVIDVLADLNLAPLWNLLSIKLLVLHDCTIDLRILFNAGVNIGTSRIADTQIMSKYIEPRISNAGNFMQIGYADLVQRWQGITINKKLQKSRWKKRPLSLAQIEYAAYDVIYLTQIYPILLNKLEEMGKMNECMYDTIVKVCRSIKPRYAYMNKRRENNIKLRTCLLVNPRTKCKFRGLVYPFDTSKYTITITLNSDLKREVKVEIKQ